MSELSHKLCPMTSLLGDKLKNARQATRTNQVDCSDHENQLKKVVYDHMSTSK